MKIFEEIEKQVKKNKRVVIGIDGPSASGKSTLGNLLKEKYDAVLFHTDNYFLPKESKTCNRLAESGGNLDYERLESEIMKNLESSTIKSNNFNCTTNLLEDRECVDSKQVIIVEGVYSLHKVLYQYYTLTIFLDVEDELQQNRILARNGEDMLERWNIEWIPLENSYFRREELKSKTDIIIDLNVKKYYDLA